MESGLGTSRSKIPHTPLILEVGSQRQVNFFLPPINLRQHMNDGIHAPMMAKTGMQKERPKTGTVI